MIGVHRCGGSLRHKLTVVVRLAVDLRIAPGRAEDVDQDAIGEHIRAERAAIRDANLRQAQAVLESSTVIPCFANAAFIRSNRVLSIGGGNSDA